MKTIIKAILVIGLCTSGILRAQVLVGNTRVDTAAYVSQITGLPLNIVRAGVPEGVITNIINGDTLLGDNLGLNPGGQNITIGGAGYASLDVNWVYSAIKQSDGSGSVVVVNITFKSSGLIGGAGVNRVAMVMNQAAVREKFKLEYEVQLRNPAWLAYRMGAGDPYGAWRNPYGLPLEWIYSWARIEGPTGRVIIGDPIIVVPIFPITGP